MTRASVRVVPARSISPSLLAAWHDLAARAVEPNPYNEPDFVLPALRHLPGGRAVGLLVVWRGRDIDACVAVQRFKRARSAPPVPALSVWSHPYQFLGTPLLDAQHLSEALAAMLSPPLAVRGASLFFTARWMSDDGPVRDALHDVLARRGREMFRWTSAPRAVLRRGSSGHPPSEKRYKRVRGYRRELERNLGPVLTRDRSSDPAAVDRFLALEASGWKGRAGTAMASRAAHAQFFREACSRFSRAGRLQLLSLEVPGRSLAMQCNLVSGKGVFHFKSAYDESFAHYRPGVQLLLDASETFWNTPSFEFLDSCTDPENTLFNDLWPDRRQVATIALPLDNHLGKAVIHGMDMLRRWRTPNPTPTG